MKKRLLLLVLVLGTAVAGFFYFKSQAEPVSGRPALDQIAASTESDDNSIASSYETLGESARPGENNTRSEHEQTDPVETSLVEFKRKRSSSVAAQLRDELNVVMSSKGFTQNEIDLTAKTVSDAFLNPEDGTIRLTAAIDSAALVLKLEDERREALTSSVMAAVGNATGRFTHTEFQVCINLRTAYASSCVKELAQELSEKVAMTSKADVLDAQTISALEPEGQEAVKKAVDVCGEDPHSAEAYLKVNLSGCL